MTARVELRGDDVRSAGAGRAIATHRMQLAGSDRIGRLIAELDTSDPETARVRAALPTAPARPSPTDPARIPSALAAALMGPDVDAALALFADDPVVRLGVLGGAALVVIRHQMRRPGST